MVISRQPTPYQQTEAKRQIASDSQIMLACFNDL